MKKKIFPIVTFVLAIVLAVVVHDDISRRNELASLTATWQEEQQNYNQIISELQKKLFAQQEEFDEFQETIYNQNLEIQYYQLSDGIDLSSLFRNYNLYRQCYLEMSWQIYGVNLLYCEDFEFPVIRAVSEDNWNLLQDADLVNFSTQEVEEITVSLCSSNVAISNFYYLPTNDKLSLAQNPPKSGWIEVSSDAGEYTIPLMEAEKHGSERYTAIKYTIGDDTYYGIIATGLKFQ